MIRCNAEPLTNALDKATARIKSNFTFITELNRLIKEKRLYTLSSEAGIGNKVEVTVYPCYYHSRLKVQKTGLRGKQRKVNVTGTEIRFTSRE